MVTPLSPCRVARVLITMATAAGEKLRGSRMKLGRIRADLRAAGSDGVNRTGSDAETEGNSGWT